MDLLLNTVDQFHGFALTGEQAVVQRIASEEQRLQAAVSQAKDENVKKALEQSVQSDRLAAQETERIYQNMVNLTNSVGNLLRSATSVDQGCVGVSCGVHASCTTMPSGPECICNEGFVGLAREGACRPPPEFMPHPLLLKGGPAAEAGVRAAELVISVFQGSKIAVVFRDMMRGSSGKVIVGRVHEAGTVDVSAPVQFTSLAGRAFSPVVVGTEDGRIVVAWRDENRLASCWLRGASLGAEGVPGDFPLTWGKAVNFCTDQAHKMSALHISGNKVALLYSDKVHATRFTPEESFGNSLLAKVGHAGDVEILGNYRFADFPVCRLQATKLSSTSFVIGARAGAVMDDSDAAVATKQEALAFYGELIGQDLVFGSDSLSIVPKEDQIWARGVSLIAPNTFAYAFQQGKDKQIRMAVAEVDPLSHHMSLVQSPVVLRYGVSPYVSMLSVPYTASDPHTLSLYESGNASKVNLCAWSVSRKQLHRCEEFEWLSQKASSVTGTSIGGGKQLMVFASESGMPYYGVFGLSKK
jgi:hypothetical protein